MEPRSLAIASLLLASLCAARAQETGFTAKIPELDLELAVGGLPPLSQVELEHSQIKRFWQHESPERKLQLSVWGLNKDIVPSPEPNSLVFQSLAALEGHKLRRRYLASGPYGYAPYAALAYANKSQTEHVLLLCGVFEQGGYVVQLEWTGALTDAERDATLGALEKGVRFSGKPWDPKWTDAEVKKRWSEAIEEDKAPDKTFRTPHYLIMTNSRAGDVYAQKMEECYRAIAAQYPFRELKGDRLLPVFVFRTRGEYNRFCDRRFSLGGSTRGIASADYYATWYESPGEKVHIHEATHQIFRNRLRLDGGGSWFQEGVAELMSTTPGQRKTFASDAARKGTYVPFKLFFVKEDLLGSKRMATGESEGERMYTQAASIIEFLRDSPFGHKKFAAFLEAVGSVQRGDLREIEAAIREVYGVDIAGLEKAWVDWWKVKG